MKKKKPEKKNPVGRPTKFNKINLEQVEILAGYGLIDTQIADVLGICEDSLNVYKKNPLFSEALKKGKIKSDTEVVKTLYKRALGFSYDEITYEKSNVGGLGVGISKEKIEKIKHCDTYKTKVVTKLVVPDVLAQIFWLKNRQSDKWRDVHQVNGVPAANITINFHTNGKPANSNRDLLSSAQTTTLPRG